MNKREAQVISLFTGFLIAPTFSWVHEYAEELLGRPVFTHEFASKALSEELKKLAEPEMMKIIKNIKERAEYDQTNEYVE